MSTAPTRRRLLTLLAALLLLLAGPETLLALEGREMLPTIGPTRARAIVDHRRRHGAFRSLDQLLASRLVGESSFAAIRPYLRLSGPPTLSGTPRPENGSNAAALPASSSSPQINLRPGAVQLLTDGDYFPVLLQHVAQARQRIELAMFLFKTKDAPDNRPAQLATALINARRRGVQVAVLLEKSGYDEGINRENEKVAHRLRQNRVNVRFDTPQTTTHTKLVVIDDRYVFIGSHNLTQAALRHNHELSLLLDNSALAQEVSGYIGRIGTGQ